MTPSERLPHDMARHARHLLFVVLLLASGGAAWNLSVTLERKAEGLTRYVRVDAWAVQEAEYELARFRALAARHVAGDPLVPLAEVRNTLHSVRGALQLLRGGTEYQQFRLLVDVDGTATAVSDALHASNEVLNNRDSLVGDLAALRTIEDAFAAPARRLRQLAIDVANIRGQLQDGDLTTMRWLITLNRWLVIGFSAAAVIFFALLVKEAIQARRAERQAIANANKSRHIAEHDTLTGLPNRRRFRTLLRERIEQARTTGCDMALHMLDLDRFKELNDTFGHDLGDKILIALAERLGSVQRTSDVLARLSGDEFALIQLAETGEIECAREAARLLDTLAQPLIIGDRNVQVGASVGVARFPADGRDAEELLTAADLALTSAKASARGTFSVYTTEMLSATKERRALQEALSRAIDNGELSVHFQPQVDLGSGRCTGAEALVRWIHPTDGFISPAVFIPIAEETGLISRLGHFVLLTACREALCWRGDAFDTVVAVNVSPAQLLVDDLVEDVRSVLERTGLPPNRLELEITEGMLMADGQAGIDMLQNLSDLGVQIAVDDFGTGYSNLSYLPRLPVDKLKIDQSFVRDIDQSDGKQTIVRAVIALADGLELKTIAEGIETPSDVAVLKALGCTEGQGYHFAKPMPPDAFMEWSCSSTPLHWPPAQHRVIAGTEA